MKYVIDLPNTYISRSTLFGDTLIIPLCLEGSKRYGIPTGIKLEPYTEPNRKVIEDEVWEFAKHVTYDMDHNDYIKCFDEVGKMHYSYNYQEAKAKYEEWLKQKDYRQDREKVIALADDIGIHNLYTLVRDIRGE